MLLTFVRSKPPRLVRNVLALGAFPESMAERAESGTSLRDRHSSGEYPRVDADSPLRRHGGCLKMQI